MLTRIKKLEKSIPPKQPQNVTHSITLGDDNRTHVEMDVDGEKMTPAEFWHRWPNFKPFKIMIDVTK